jgi:hypothetical protein
MAKRSGYSTLDYILGGLAGGLRGYGEDKERRKLEAEREAERAALQEERRASRERQEMLDRVMLSDRGYEPARELSEVTDRNVDMPHRLLRPTAEQRYDMPDFTTQDASPLQRALETASSGRPTETVGGQRMVRTMTPMEEAEQERSSAALSGRMEAQGRAQTHRGKYDTIRQAYPQFNLPPYDPNMDLGVIESVAKQQAEPVRGAAPQEPPTRIRELRILQEMFPDADPEELAAAVGFEFGRPGQQPSGPRMPGSTVEKIALNNAIVESSDEILGRLDSETGGALGLRFKTPLVGSLLERTGSEADQALRAQISNIGSQLLQARSGAAISAAEFERLSPFVPAISDNPEMVKAKLKSLSTELRRINNAYNEAFGTQQGSVRYPPDSLESILNEVYR